MDNDDLVRLDHQLCFSLYAASRAVVKAYQPMLKELQLTYPQYLVLMVLWEWDDLQATETSVTALGKRLMLDSGTLTPLLKRMERDKLLVRQRASADERKVLISLSTKGRSKKAVAIRCLSSSLGRFEPHAPQLLELRGQLKELINIIHE